MNGADAGAGQHRDGSFRNHRQVENDTVAPADTACAERTGEARGEPLQLGISEALDDAGDGTIVDQCGLFAAPSVHVAIQRVVAGIDLGAWEPAGEGRA